MEINYRITNRTYNYFLFNADGSNIEIKLSY